MNNPDYRLKEFLPDSQQPALLLDASAGLALGALPGLENFETGVRPRLPSLDGLVCSPGQLRRLTGLTRVDGALLVRMDWTNTLRGETFPLSPEKATYTSILEPEDALAMGASGMVTSFLLGYEEAIEAACLKATVQLALTGRDLGIPLVVEICPRGPRISLPGKAVELGASFALESGADVIVVPDPGPDSLKTIAAMLSVPWLFKPASIGATAAVWEIAFGLGAAGLWLDHTSLRSDLPLEEFAARVHESPAKIGLSFNE